MNVATGYEGVGQAELDKIRSISESMFARRGIPRPQPTHHVFAIPNSEDRVVMKVSASTMFTANAETILAESNVQGSPIRELKSNDATVVVAGNTRVKTGPTLVSNA